MPSSQPPNTRAPLSRDRVLDAALVIADQDGLAAVSMRRVAQALGVEAMSLYNHVANKQDLLAGLIEQVVGQITPPRPEHNWQDEMRIRARTSHAVLMAHPWAAQLIVANAQPGPVMLTYVEKTLACLAAAGFSPQLADHAWNAMDSYIYGFTLQRINFPFEPEDYAAAAAENMDMIPAAIFPNLRALAKLVANRQHDGLHNLDFGFDLLLAGLEQRRLSEQNQ